MMKSEKVMAADSPKSHNITQYNIMEEYSPRSVAARQRSMTNLAEAAQHSPILNKPPKAQRQSSLKRITMSLKSQSAPVLLSSSPEKPGIVVLEDKNSKKSHSKSSSTTKPSSPKKLSPLSKSSSDIDSDTVNLFELSPRLASRSSDGAEISSEKDKDKDSAVVGRGRTYSMRVKQPDASPLLSSMFKNTSNSELSQSSNGGHNSLPSFPLVKDGDQISMPKPMLLLEGPVFGCPLPELLVKESRISRGDYKIFIPYLIENCVVNLLKDEVLQMEGIFRQSGRLTDNQCMKAFYDKGKYLNLSEYPDLYTVAALLKQYLRELPEPVIPYCMYSCFLSIGRRMNSGGELPLDSLREMIKLLPMTHKTILKIIIALLAKAATMEKDNKMSPSNLAIVIAPNIMWSKSRASALDEVTDSPAVNQIAFLLITHYDTLFNEDEDTKGITLDVLCKQHNSLTFKFPSYAVVQEEEKALLAQQQARKKNGFFNDFFGKSDK